MPVAASKKCERTEYQVAGNSVRCDDKTAGLDCILYQDFAVGGVSQPGNELCIGHACIYLRVPPDIPQPSTGEDAGFFRQAEFFCNGPALFYQFKFFCNRP